ncbi:MAG: acetate/propionate family kinase [Cyanobacteria bacterium RI_101]|nr:acetate/propionate family kinase [Cyanobacteria bacterium RI_101]
MKILVLNAGSSSQKSCLYDLSPESLPSAVPEPLWEAFIDWTVEAGHGILTVEAKGQKRRFDLDSGDRIGGVARMLNTLVEGDSAVLGALKEITAVGHRVVHGGAEYTQSVWITPEVKATIARLIPLAPNHNPAHLEGMDAIEQALGAVPQFAVFDTAFHQTIPPAAAYYPLPWALTEKGVRRYGFHGTSHRYCAQQAARILGQPLENLKLVTCHIGNGASLAAVADGQCLDTTMGFTPLEGLMMGARSGSIDPAILIYLMREEGYSADQLNDLLNKQSGLLGVSGLSADLRTVLEAEAAGDPRATLAVNMYVHRFRSFLGQMIATLGGLDTLVFTAGVGENSALIRERVCQNFAFLGLTLDEEKNRRSPRNQLISAPESSVKVLIIHTEEDWAIATEGWELLQSQPGRES